jgi:hypothetical protein
MATSKDRVRVKGKPYTKWKATYPVQVYRMVRLGMSDTDICKNLRISRQAYYRWMRDYPELKDAVETARKEVECSETFPEWVYGRLSPELKGVWDKICQFRKDKAPVSQIELLLQDHGKRVRQQLFLFALCVENFCPSAAMHRVNVSKREVERWMEEDGDFSQLVAEVDWHKGNFFEYTLVQLVREGNPQAVMFANKTYNAGKGYGRRDTVDVNVSGSVVHGVLDLAELLPHLSESTKLELLAAIRHREQVLQAQKPPSSPGELMHRKIVEAVSE